MRVDAYDVCWELSSKEDQEKLHTVRVDACDIFDQSRDSRW